MAIVVFGKKRPPLTFLTIAPKVKASLFQLVITLISGVDRPSNSIKLKNKRPRVHISMVHRTSATLSTKIKLVRITFPSPKNNNRVRSLSFPSQWKLKSEEHTSEL